MEFLDINPVLTRVVGSHLAFEPRNTSPWRLTPPTLTGSSKIAVRFKKQDLGFPSSTWFVRILEAFEYMRLQGWGDEQWNAYDIDETTPKGVYFLELIANMAGNAFSVFHYGPVVQALLATFGKFKLARTQALPQQEDQAAGEDRSPTESYSLSQSD